MVGFLVVGDDGESKLGADVVLSAIIFRVGAGDGIRELLLALGSKVLVVAGDGATDGVSLLDVGTEVGAPPSKSSSVIGELFVVGATVKGAVVLGDSVVGDTVKDASIVGGSAVGDTVKGAGVVGGPVVGDTVNGASVVGSGDVSGDAPAVGATVKGATLVVLLVGDKVVFDVVDGVLVSDGFIASPSAKDGAPVGASVGAAVVGTPVGALVDGIADEGADADDESV
jgi:hypothetical protein